MWNVAQTEVIVKVDGADKDWRRDKAWIGDAIAVYDLAAIEDLRDMLGEGVWATG